MQVGDFNRKIITVSYVCFAFLFSICVNVVLEMLASAWGVFSRYYDLDWVRHGVPISLGIIFFFILQFNPKILKYSDEVVTEVSKVSWPGKKDTFSMVFVVCVILIISGIILGLLDFFSRSLLNTIMSL